MPKVYDKVTPHTKPDWLKIRLPHGEGFAGVERIAREHRLHTICSSGLCPNKSECWSSRTATFMIMGERCSRSCRFCATVTGGMLPLDEDEPANVARSIDLMGLRHAVITSVTRDDLADGGAEHWASVISTVRAVNPGVSVEVLIPDMDARGELIDIILAAGPQIVGHNIETVKRLTPAVRSRAKYDVSLRTLRHITDGGTIAKSGMMLGLGESDSEIVEALADLRGAGVRIVTIGQYLRPTMKHLPVERYVSPQEFDSLRAIALDMGFDYVASGPLVRSSYKAHEALEAVSSNLKTDLP